MHHIRPDQLSYYSLTVFCVPHLQLTFILFFNLATVDPLLVIRCYFRHCSVPFSRFECNPNGSHGIRRSYTCVYALSALSNALSSRLRFPTDVALSRISTGSSFNGASGRNCSRFRRVAAALAKRASKTSRTPYARVLTRENLCPSPRKRRNRAERFLFHLRIVGAGNDSLCLIDEEERSCHSGQLQQQASKQTYLVRIYLLQPRIYI